jgi:hypothetical protein
MAPTLISAIALLEPKQTREELHLPVGFVLVEEVPCLSSSHEGPGGAAPGPEDALGLHELVHRDVVHRVSQPQDCADSGRA